MIGGKGLSNKRMVVKTDVCSISSEYSRHFPALLRLYVECRPSSRSSIGVLQSTLVEYNSAVRQTHFLRAPTNMRCPSLSVDGLKHQIVSHRSCSGVEKYVFRIA